MKSKVIFFLLYTAFFLTNIGCGDKYANKLGGDHIIPYTRVYTEIPLGGGGEDPLSWLSQPRYFSTSAPNPGSLGYKGHGIVVFTTNMEDFHCYDATCTNCSDLESFFTEKDFKGSSVICPICGTEFDLNTGYAFGNTQKIYPLKPYPVIKRGNTLVVSNQ